MSFYRFTLVASTIPPGTDTSVSASASCLLTPLSLIFCLSGEHSHTHINTRWCGSVVNSPLASTRCYFLSNNEVVKRLMNIKFGDVAQRKSICALSYSLCVLPTFALISVWIIESTFTQTAYQQPQDKKGAFLDPPPHRKPHSGAVMTEQSWSPDGSCLCISGVHSDMAQGLFHLQQDMFRLWLCQWEQLLCAGTDNNTETNFVELITAQTASNSSGTLCRW